MNQWVSSVHPNEAGKGNLGVIAHGRPRVIRNFFNSGKDEPAFHLLARFINGSRVPELPPCRTWVRATSVELLPPHECERLDAEYGLGDLEVRQ